MLKKHIAMCGLDCVSCNAFIATKNNDNGLRKKTAEEWTARRASQNKPPVKPEDINCSGCLSKNKPIYQNCLICVIRKCGFNRKVKNCQECEDYKCGKLLELKKRLF